MKTKSVLAIALMSFGLLTLQPLAAKEKKEKVPVPEFPFKRFYVDVSVGQAGRLGVPEIKGFNSSGYDPVIVMFNFGDQMAVGKGLRVGLNLGYRFNRHVALEVNGFYITRPENIVSSARIGHTFAFAYDNEGTFNRSLVLFYWGGVSASAQRGGGSVQAVFSPGLKNRVNPYLKFGIGTFGGTLTHNASVAFSENEDEVYKNEEWQNVMLSHNAKTGFFMLGFLSGIGFECRITPRWTFFSEWQLSVYSQSYFDWLPNEKHTFNLENTNEVARLDYPFGNNETIFGSNHGLNLGVRINF